MLEGMFQERETGMERAMAGQWEWRGNKKPLGGEREGRQPRKQPETG